MAKISEIGIRLITAFQTDDKSEIAEKLGFSSVQAVYKVIAGEREMDFEKLIKFQNSTNCSISWLLTGEGEKFLAVKKHSVSEIGESKELEFHTIADRLASLLELLRHEKKLNEKSVLMHYKPGSITYKSFAKGSLFMPMLEIVSKDTNINLHYLLTGTSDRFIGENKIMEVIRNLVKEEIFAKSSDSLLKETVKKEIEVSHLGNVGGSPDESDLNTQNNQTGEKAA